MEITNIKIRKILTEGRMRAIISVTIDDELAIHDIKVIEGNDRLFVAMPSRKAPDGSHKDIVHPIRESGRSYFETAIIEAYNDYLKNNESEINSASQE